MVGTRGDGTAGGVEGRVINGLFGYRHPRGVPEAGLAEVVNSLTLYRTGMPLGSAARVVGPALLR
jgi:hypothetical protein